MDTSVTQEQNTNISGLVTVILPTYNRAATIKRACMSVLNQTYRNLELIVVDDGSTDETKRILERIHDDRLFYIHQVNSGACTARNNGIDHAHGEYIAFQDSDDEWLPNKLERQMEVMRYVNADIVFCGMSRHGYGNRDEGNIYPNIREGRIFERQLISNSIVSTQTMLCKSYVFKVFKFDVDMPRLQDYELVIRMASTFTFYYLKEPLVEVFLQEDSLTKDEDKTIKAVELLLERDIGIFERYPQRKAEFLNTVGNLKRGRKERGVTEYLEAFSSTKNIKYLIKYIMTKPSIMSKKKGDK